MKTTLLRLLAAMLATLTLLTACTPAAVPEDTTAADTTLPEETTAEAPPVYVRDTYEDLSGNVPEITGADGKSSTVTAKGELNAPDVVLSFDGESGLFAVSSNVASIHDTATCDQCGFTENGDYALLCHGENSTSAGFMITLATPVPLTSVTGMTATFRTTKKASSSVIRIMAASCTTMATFHNECPTIGDATADYVTMDINLTEPDKLNDNDGNISSFQFYFRNKEGMDMFLKTLTINVNPEKLLVVEELDGNYFSRGDVTSAIATAIAERFEAANVGAEITVEVDQYRQNNTKMDGSILYAATATLNDGTVVTGKGKVVIPHVSGAWLDNTGGSFGSSHDNLGQWQETFDPSGMVLLTNNTISAKEGIATAEYALIPEDGDYTSDEVVWRAPHVLAMGDKSINTLFVNAWLDHAETLTEGQRYRLLVRGVTKNHNYVLHLDIPFTYSPLEQTVNDSLNNAIKTMESAAFICPADNPDKVAYINQQLTAILNDPALEVRTIMLGEGVNSATVQVKVLSNASVTAERLPAYVIDGQTLTSVYAFEGDAMTTNVLNFAFTEFDGSIKLLSPFDGDTTVAMASPDIYALWNAPMDKIESGKYPFKRGENCLPTPAELTWSDETAGSKTYTVTVSKNRDLSDPIVLTSAECRVAVYDLEIGRQYFWQVTDGTATSQIYTFTTAIYPRFFAIDGVSNFRDIGGYYTTDGKRVKQNMVYRSAYLNDCTPEAKDFMLNELGLKAELDLRGSGAATFGKEVNRRVIAMQWYNHIFTESNYEVVRQTISAFADPNNYPMNFHCAVGRDRTGTTAFLILGLLGVDEETLLREYYSSFFSSTGSCPKDEFVLHVANIDGLMNGLSRFAKRSAPMQEKIEAYLLHIGVTEAEIASIREILLEE